MTRVLICHDWALVREGMRTQLERTDDAEVVGTTDSGIAAVVEAMSGGVDVMVTGLHLRGIDGLELVQRARAACPTVRIIVVFDGERDVDLDEIVSVAPEGVVPQECSSEEFCLAVEAVSAGQTVLAGTVATELLERARATPSRSAAHDGADLVAVPQMTARELEILHLVARGQSTEEIAGSLVIALTTVRTHLYRLRAKLGVRDRAGLVSFAFRHGMVDAA